MHVYARSLILSVILFAAADASAGGRCGAVFSERIRLQDPLLEADLLTVQRQETDGKTPEQVSEMNRWTFEALAAEPLPGGFSGRVISIDPGTTTKIIASIGKHPVMQAASSGRYSQRETEIGYCFGRATYAHLALLKMGVDRDSIRKIWAVGEMKGYVSWQFHVATIVRQKDGKWYAIDNFFGSHGLEVSQWFAGLQKQNKKGDLRVYITDPSKFSVSLGAYDNVQLGLKISKEQDWYRGYFQDLMTWFRTGTLESVGLSKLKK